MPLEPHEELKLSWETAVMDMQIDRGRVDIEKIRLEVDRTHIETQKIHVEMQKMIAETQKTLQDLTLDSGRLRVQVWTAVGALMTGSAALVGTGIAIGHFFTK